MRASTVTAVIIGVVAATTVVEAVKVVQPGTVGVPVNFGKVSEETLQPGLHIVTPFVTDVRSVDTQTLRSDIRAEASTSDLQVLPNSILAVNWNIDPSKASAIVSQFGSRDNLLQRVINPVVEQVFKDMASKRTATQLITERQQFSVDVRERIKAALAQYPVTIDGVSIVNLDFSPEFSKAVELNQIAVRKKATAEAEAAAQIATAEGQAKAQVASARGQAESQKLLQQSATPEVIRLKQLEVQRAAIDKWDGKLPKVTGGNNILQLPTLENSSSK